MPERAGVNEIMRMILLATLIVVIAAIVASLL